MESKRNNDPFWLDDLRSFIKDLFRSATWWITSSIIAAVGTVYSFLGGKMPHWLVWAFVALAFQSGGFIAYRKQMQEKKILQAEKSKAANKKTIDDELGLFKKGLADRIIEIRVMDAERYAKECPAKNGDFFDSFTLILLETIVYFLEKHYTKIESALFNSLVEFELPIMPATSSPEHTRWKLVIARLQHHERQLELIISRLPK
jgi:hypothetical protein